MTIYNTKKNSLIAANSDSEVWAMGMFTWCSYKHINIIIQSYLVQTNIIYSLGYTIWWTLKIPWVVSTNYSAIAAGNNSIYSNNWSKMDYTKCKIMNLYKEFVRRGQCMPINDNIIKIVISMRAMPTFIYIIWVIV